MFTYIDVQLNEMMQDYEQPSPQAVLQPFLADFSMIFPLLSALMLQQVSSSSFNRLRPRCTLDLTEG